MSAPNLNRLIAEEQRLQAQLNASRDRAFKAEQAVRDAEAAIAKRERERIAALNDAEDYYRHPDRAAGLIHRYINGNEEHRKIIQDAAALLIPYREGDFEREHPNYAFLPTDGRLVTLGAFLRIMPEDNNHPTLVFDAELFRKNRYQFRHFAGPADLRKWQQALPIIRRHLDPDLEWQVRQVDSIHIELTCREPLPDLLEFDLGELKRDHFTIGWSLADAMPFQVPFDDVLHTVIAGVTGAGKSTAMHGMILSALFSADRFETIHLYDGKFGEEFARYRRFPQVILHNSLDDLYALTTALVQLMAQRQAANAELGRRRHDGPITWLVIDECQTLFGIKPVGKDQKDRHGQFLIDIADLARRGRSSNIRLLFCTQKPTADALPTEILNNCSTRIAFRLGIALTQHGMFPGKEGLPDLMSLPDFRAVFLHGRKQTLTEIQVGLPDDQLDPATLIAAGEAARLAPPVETTPPVQLIAPPPPDPPVPLSGGCTDLDPPADDVETRHDELREPAGIAAPLQPYRWSFP